MTRYLLFLVGLLTIVIGVVAPYQANSLWSFFMSVSPATATARELLGLAMITYAGVPELRTRYTARAFGGLGAGLLIFSLSAVWFNHVSLLDAFIFSLAGIFCLLGSLELPVKQLRASSPTNHFKRLQMAAHSHIRHAH